MPLLCVHRFELSFPDVAQMCTGGLKILNLIPLFAGVLNPRCKLFFSNFSDLSFVIKVRAWCIFGTWLMPHT